MRVGVTYSEPESVNRISLFQAHSRQRQATRQTHKMASRQTQKESENSLTAFFLTVSSVAVQPYLLANFSHALFFVSRSLKYVVQTKLSIKILALPLQDITRELVSDGTR